MIDCRFRPLSGWPRPATKDRRNATFRATYTKTLDELENELNYLGALDIIIETFHKREDIRNDGWPRSNAREPVHPGVIVSFGTKLKRPLQFVCDTFTDWRDNLRAIAKTLENLRAVERYGATQRGEQYRGYTAIESKSSITFSSVEAAAKHIVMQSGRDVPVEDVMTDPERCSYAYREGARVLHPDASGGDAEEFRKLRAAKDMLDAHHDSKSGTAS